MLIEQLRIALAVVNYGTTDLLATNRTLRLPGVAVYVVDNYKDHAERVAIRALAEERGWRLLPAATNVGFGAGINAAVKAVEGTDARTLIALNPDAEIEETDLVRLASSVRASDICFAAPEIRRPDGSVWFSGARVSRQTGSTEAGFGAASDRDRRWLTGAVLAANVRSWQAVSGFDERYFLYWEDIDLSARVHRSGGSLLLVPEATAIHAVGGSQSGRGKSPSYIYYNTRNRLLFAALHLSHRDQLRWVASTPRYTWEVLHRGGRAALVANLGPLALAAVRGTCAGLGILMRSRCGRLRSAPLTATRA